LLHLLVMKYIDEIIAKYDGIDGVTYFNAFVNIVQDSEMYCTEKQFQKHFFTHYSVSQKKIPRKLIHFNRNLW